jgi:hypothetical protein
VFGVVATMKIFSEASPLIIILSSLFIASHSIIERPTKLTLSITSTTVPGIQSVAPFFTSTTVKAAGFIGSFLTAVPVVDPLPKLEHLRNLTFIESTHAAV